MPLLSTFGAASARSFGGIGAAAAGAGLDIDEAFSTDLWTGDATNITTITNGIDLVNEGGLVWFKARSAAYNHTLFDTVRGDSKNLTSNSNAVEGSLQMDVLNGGGGFTTFKNNGFSVRTANGGINGNGTDLTAWTFRKAPKFFDIVTYAGNGTAGRQISHSLGTTVGAIFIKSLNNTRKWCVYHRGTDASNPSHYKMHLNETDARSDEIGCWNDTEPTSTVFTVGNDGEVNASGENYVAYLFAHHDGDGGFGPDSDADVIKCGSYTGNGSTSGPEINLGFEPQFLMIKKYSGGTGSWEVVDIMRGFPVDTAGDRVIRWNSVGAENTGDALPVGKPTATGFQILTDESHVNQSGHGYIYMAIRRGPLAEPENATDVFQPHTYTGDGSTRKYSLNITPDMVINRNRSGAGDSSAINDRLRGTGKEMYTSDTGTEASYPSLGMQFDHTNAIEVQDYRDTSGTNYLNLCWKRAPGFFDVIAYTGGGYNTNVKHNLGVTPELCIAKSRTTNSVVDDWYVWCSHSGDGNDTVGFLNSTGTSALGFHASSPSATDLYLHGNVAYSTYPYVMYLFASLAGVSKVGSYTGNGTSQTIDCGFSAGARFVLIKRTDTNGDWWIFDTARGIVTGNDSYLALNSTIRENAYGAGDNIDPNSTGFTINQEYLTQANVSSGAYIFYAIA